MKVIYLAIFTIFTLSCGQQEPNNEHPQFIFAQIISDNTPNVLSDVSLFLSSKNAYKQQYKDNLEYHGYEAPFDNEFDFTFVIVESLKANGLAIDVDWREAPRLVLDSLNRTSNNRLSVCASFEQLKNDFAKTGNNISFYLESKDPQSLLLQCSKSVGLEIIGIDNGSDSYVLTLASVKSLSKILEYSKKSEIKLNTW
ncbi:DUF6630 family protein [Paraglaciecola arctica]|uniref:DUF6630 family protein n=1 Tax=Paraglaciecola arctica TaxID=1128911 RepID=UPI001C07C58A|nr:DUF6630 family protein [Paraglaciecola arctica]MBU3006159.1 hypothetical protein [Paraglaciecola arctica]